MRKENIIKLVVAIFFLVPLIFWVFELKDYINAKDTYKNGIETTAIVYDASNDVTVNGVPKYTLLYKFYDEDGILHDGKSSCDYTAYDVDQIMEGTKEISIKYNPSTFYSIQSNYSGKPQIIIYILPIFGLISIILIISAIREFVYLANSKKIIANGSRTKGTIIDTKLASSVNHVQFYSIQYTYKDNQGIQHTTRSKGHYNWPEVEALKQKEFIDIAYIGNKSVIVQEDGMFSNKTYQGIANTSMAPSPMAPQYNNTNINENYSQNNNSFDTKSFVKKKCEYCGADLPDGELVCPSCGAKNFAD